MAPQGVPGLTYEHVGDVAVERLLRRLAFAHGAGVPYLGAAGGTMAALTARSVVTSRARRRGGAGLRRLGS